MDYSSHSPQRGRVPRNNQRPDNSSAAEHFQTGYASGPYSGDLNLSSGSQLPGSYRQQQLPGEMKPPTAYFPRPSHGQPTSEPATVGVPQANFTDPLYFGQGSDLHSGKVAATPSHGDTYVQGPGGQYFSGNPPDANQIYSTSPPSFSDNYVPGPRSQHYSDILPSAQPTYYTGFEQQAGASGIYDMQPPYPSNTALGQGSAGTALGTTPVHGHHGAMHAGGTFPSHTHNAAASQLRFDYSNKPAPTSAPREPDSNYIAQVDQQTRTARSRSRRSATHELDLPTNYIADLVQHRRNDASHSRSRSRGSAPSRSGGRDRSRSSGVVPKQKHRSHVSKPGSTRVAPPDEKPRIHPYYHSVPFHSDSTAIPPIPYDPAVHLPPRGYESASYQYENRAPSEEGDEDDTDCSGT